MLDRCCLRLAGLLVFSCCVAAAGWTAPVNVTNIAAGQRACGPRIAADGYGNLHLVWVGGTDPGENWRVYYQSYNGSAWSSALAVPLSGAGAGNADIAVDGSNNLHVVYDQDEEIYYLKRTGGLWSVPFNLSNNGNKSIIPKLAVDSSGNHILVAWHEQGHVNGTYDIITRKNTNGVWDSAHNLSNDGALSAEPRVAVDASGNFHVIWDSDDDVYYARRNANGAWTANVRLDANSDRSGTGSVAVTPNNLVHAIYHDDDGDGGWDSVYRSYNGSSWTAPATISNNTGVDNDDIDSALAVDGLSNLYAVWHDYDDVFYATRTGSVWSTPIKIVAGKYLATDPEIALTTDGNVHVVWQSRPTSPDRWNIYWSSQAAPPPPVRGTLAGTVRDQFGTAVASATVTAGAETAATDAGGAYSMLLSPGTYSATAGKTYHAPQTQNNIGIVANTTTTIHFTIARQPPSAVRSFTVTAGNAVNQLNWGNPTSGQFTGTMIRFKTTGTPTGPTDGTLLLDKAGAPNSNDSHTHSGLNNGTTLYYAAFAHDDGSPNLYAAGLAASGTPALTIDRDRDGDVDMSDFGWFQTCLTGASVPQYATECADAMLDADTDVDPADLAKFLVCFQGPNTISPADCLN